MKNKISMNSKTLAVQQKAGGGGIKALSCAVLASFSLFGAAAYAEDFNVINNSNPLLGRGQGEGLTGFAAEVVLGSEESQAILSQKPVNTPTLDYLRENNIKIPQKGAYDPDTKTWAEAPSIDAPKSAYKITEGTIDDHSFEYKTYNEDGSVTSSYYKIDLKSSPLGGEDAGEGAGHITWQEVDAAGEKTIEVNLSNDVTKYYQYTYNKPENYIPVTERINDTLNASTVTNVVLENLSSTTDGGAIYNTQDNATVDVVADFINNSAKFYGGAIHNSENAAIGEITGDFINNSAYYGGAISNAEEAAIDNITGNFISNEASLYGGAINNASGAIIGNITGNFVNNTTHSKGGAIRNDSGKIGNITGRFINNVADTYGNPRFGGAIYNEKGTISNITGEFISNRSGRGGAVYNSGTVNNITGIFINSVAKDTNQSSDGAAIYNAGKLGNITGDFIHNTADDEGGAIYNDNGSTIGEITGDFISNRGVRGGGAIFNRSKIANITGDFINNSANYSGGAINNTYGSIGNITGNFIKNSSIYVSGGAIYNSDSWIDNITGNFIDNSAKNFGGAIFNSRSIGDITGDFINNSTGKHGGTIYNSKGTIGNIKGNFISNSAGSDGGAIYSQQGTIRTITGDLVNNSAVGDGGAIYNYWTTIDNLTGNFVNNSASNGGAIYNIVNASHIKKITGDFIDNSADNGSGGAIYNSNDSKIGDIIGNFVNNSASNGSGGAIYNKGTIGEKDADGNVTGGIINALFVGNYAKSESGDVQGGAIWTDKNIYIIADNGTSEFSGNYTQVGEEKDDNAIYLAAKDINLNFNLKNNGKVVMKDNIRGADTYNVNITGDGVDTTTFYMLNDMYNANLNLSNTTISTINNSVHIYPLNSLTVKDNTNFVADVDLLNQEMDRFTANQYGTHTGNLNVVGMNILTDAPPERDLTAIYFAQPGLKNNVTNGLGELPQSQYQNFEVYTPIYKYNVTYDNKNQYNGKGDGGYFLFTKGDKYFRPGDLDPENPTTPITPGGNTGNPSDAFNPAVLTAPVSTVAASQATLNEVFKYVFEHADAFTQLPQIERFSLMESNKYAMSTDFNDNLNKMEEDIGSLCYHHDDNKAVWVRPFTTFEDINMKNGPAVDAITYGTIIGYDGDFKEMRNGWHRLGTAYLGYNGSQLSYAGNDTTMNGGLLGLTETYYKGNFWTALTASAGASVGETTTMYGKEDYTNLLAGVASKTGYNFEFKEGRYIIQPIMFLSYTFVNTFDYTNAAGVKIDTKPAHSILLHPNVRFIMNCKNGWQPYAQAGVVWNVMNKAHVTANGVRLPNMRMEPYAEYGLGVQRNWKDKFTVFGQAMIRNGGRTGIAFTAGFRWAIGRDKNHNHEHVYNQTKKVIKKASL